MSGPTEAPAWHRRGPRWIVCALLTNGSVLPCRTNLIRCRSEGIDRNVDHTRLVKLYVRRRGHASGHHELQGDGAVVVSGGHVLPLQGDGTLADILATQGGPRTLQDLRNGELAAELMAVRRKRRPLDQHPLKRAIEVAGHNSTVVLHSNAIDGAEDECLVAV